MRARKLMILAALIVILSDVAFAATATPVRMVIAAGNNQSALVGTAVPGIVCVQVFDANNVGVGGVTVTWGALTGGGSLVGAVQITNAAGIATLTSWTLGAGNNTTTASSTGINSVTFSAIGVTTTTAVNAVIQWDNALLHAISVDKVGPTIASRAMAMVHTGIYDAWANYDGQAIGTRLGGTLRRPSAERTTENKQKALSYAAYKVLLDLFPSQKSDFDAQMVLLGYDPNDNSTDTSPAGIGNTVAAALLTYRHADGSNQLGDLNPGAYSDYTSYTPVNTPTALNDLNHWQPLVVAGVTQQFLTPFWGFDDAFAIGAVGSASRKSLIPRVKPAQSGTIAFNRQSADLIALSANLNDQTKTIASYWADAGGTVTPPGHWMQFAQFVSQRDKHELDDDVKMFFALSNTLFDVGIMVWEVKRKFDYVRPITAIHYLYNGKTIKAWGGVGKGTQDMPGENFTPYIPTPPFPEYVSGHSTYSAAGAQLLAYYTRKLSFGMSVTLQPGSSVIEPGVVPAQAVTLSWPNFLDAANQAGMSRRYGGIHFKDADLQGRELGRKIAYMTWLRARRYFFGIAK